MLTNAPIHIYTSSIPIYTLYFNLNFKCVYIHLLLNSIGLLQMAGTEMNHIELVFLNYGTESVGFDQKMAQY